MIVRQGSLLATTSAALMVAATVIVPSGSSQPATWSQAPRNVPSSTVPRIVTVRPVSPPPGVIRVSPQSTRVRLPVGVPKGHTPTRTFPTPHKAVAASGEPSKSAKRQTYRIDGVTRGGQSTIDSCRYVLWRGPAPGETGTTWIAAHNYCHHRYFAQWMAYLPVGARVTVSGLGRTASYVVTGRRYLNRQTGNATGFIYGALVLQTCKGRGTEFTYARLVT